MGKKELAAEICPGHTVRGIYELFQDTQPFQDNVNPTKAEVDHWHAIVINHVRAMVNYTEADYQIKPDTCLHLRALWSTERQKTRQWDVKYPNNTCVGSSNPHCGAGFLPSEDDQQEYLPDGIASCGKKGGSEGLFSAAKSNVSLFFCSVSINQHDKFYPIKCTYIYIYILFVNKVLILI